MLRLSPPGQLRFTQARSFDAIYGGGEANVAVSLRNFGVETEYITRLPANDLGEACLQFLRQYGVGTRHVLRGGERLGIYYLEHGAAQRGSNVIYDRAQSSFASLQKGMIAWDQILAGADWFHWTGITPAISKGTAEACLEGVQAAKKMGLTISCDLNYRAKLWKWGKAAREVMGDLVELCDLAIGNEEDSEKIFGIGARGVDVTSGRLDPARYQEVCHQLVQIFPALKTIAITLRGSLSASHNTWSAVLWSAGQLLQGSSYELNPIIDRVGGGDSFAAGLIYGLLTWGDNPQRALDFAVAASALKHTVFGDFNLVSAGEVERLMSGDQSGRVSR